MFSNTRNSVDSDTAAAATLLHQLHASNNIDHGTENNNLYYYTPSLAAHLGGPEPANAAENPTFVMLNSSSDSVAARLAVSPSDPSPLMNNMNMMMADGGGEPDISDFRMRAVMIFTYFGFAFLSIVLLGTFVVSLYWTLSGSCSKRKGEQPQKRIQNGSCCSIEDPMPPPKMLQSVSNGNIGSSATTAANGSVKKSRSRTKSPPKSTKYNETELVGDEESNCELLEWDRQTQVIEMEDL